MTHRTIAEAIAEAERRGKIKGLRAALRIAREKNRTWYSDTNAPSPIGLVATITMIGDALRREMKRGGMRGTDG